MIKITTMTTMCADIFDASGEIRPGGEALNFAAIASEYSYIDVGIIGAIGDDLCGEKVLASIKNKRIDKSAIHVIPGGATASNRIYLTKEGDRYFKEDSWNSGVYGTYQLAEDDVVRIKNSDLVFINYYSTNFEEVLELRKKNDFKLAVDFDVFRAFDQLQDCISYIDFFFISGKEEILPQFEKWSEEYTGIFNITLAEKGSVSYVHGREYRVKAVEVEQVVDTTGCGDSYHAGFICSYVKNYDIVEAMNEGAKVASDTLSHIGGFRL